MPFKIGLSFLTLDLILLLIDLQFYFHFFINFIFFTHIYFLASPSAGLAFLSAGV